MGYIFADLELSNPKQDSLQPIKVKALADTGALMLCIPEHIALQMNLKKEATREISVADGRSINVPYVGPIKVAFGKRFCFVGELWDSYFSRGFCLLYWIVLSRLLFYGFNLSG